MRKNLFVFALLAFAAFEILRAASRTSATFDEALYVGAGAYVAKTGDFGIDSLWYNGPLSYYVNSLLFPWLDVGESFYVPADRKPAQFWGGHGVALLSRADLPEDRVLRFARYPFVLVFVGLALTTYFWTRRLYGGFSAMAALALMCCCPTLLAHSAVATMDLTVTLTFLWAVMACHAFQRSPSRERAALVGFCVALALLSKPTAILLLPLVPALLWITVPRRDLTLARAAWAFFVAALTVHAAYGFTFSSLTTAAERPHDQLDRLFRDSPRIGAWIQSVAERVPIPAPAFWKMLFITPLRLGTPRNIYFLGVTAPQRFFAYFPVALFLKNTIPLILLFALAAAVRVRAGARALRSEAFVLLPMAALLLVGFTQQHTIGVRYMLPIFPFLIVFAASAAPAVGALPRVGKPLLLSLLAWSAWTTAAVAPNLLSYFNEWAGGPANGYRYLVDSDLDWGQNHRDIRDWMRARGVERVTLGVESMIDPARYGIAYDKLTCEPRPGIIIVSLTVLMPSITHVDPAARRCLSWLAEADPVDKIAYSTWVYRR